MITFLWIAFTLLCSFVFCLFETLETNFEKEYCFILLFLAVSILPLAGIIDLLIEVGIL